MHRVLLLLGSNLGDKPATLHCARALIMQNIGRIVQQSALYESEAWGFESASRFINQVIKINTALSPAQLLVAAQQIETQLGRIRHEHRRYTSRTIDIDILFFDRQCVNTTNLTIPHPLLHERLFTLVPLHEIAPNLRHPTLHKTIAELLLAKANSGEKVQKVDCRIS